MAGGTKRAAPRGANRRAGRAIVPVGLEQVRALAHPLRLRLLELFAERVRTTKQAAEALGEAPTRLYHHVATLERAGLVRLRETRRVRGATEKYFEVVTRDLKVPRARARAGRRQGEAREQAALGMLLFDQARNDLVRALAACEEGAPEDLMAVHGVLRLSPAQVTRLRSELTRLLRRLGAAPGRGGKGARDGRRRYSLTIALVPAEPERE
jgi:DNA-binding transcriptional ArsR family regulator